MTKKHSTVRRERHNELLVNRTAFDPCRDAHVPVVAEAQQFYISVFGLTVHFEGDDNVVFKFGNTLINLLAEPAAPHLIHPARVADAVAGVRFQFTIGVEDVDLVCVELSRLGVALLNGPMDRWWGMPTASFKDPGGHIWEITASIE